MESPSRWSRKRVCLSSGFYTKYNRLGSLNNTNNLCSHNPIWSVPFFSCPGPKITFEQVQIGVWKSREQGLAQVPVVLQHPPTTWQDWLSNFSASWPSWWNEGLRWSLRCCQDLRSLQRPPSPTLPFLPLFLCLTLPLSPTESTPQPVHTPQIPSVNWWRIKDKEY